MSTILDLELQCPLLHHGLVHLYPREITRVYAACVALRETIEGDRAWLDSHCRHVLPHSYGDVPFEDWSGLRCWYRDGKIHRDGDLPARIKVDGSQSWYKEAKLHRDNDLPAEIRADGTQWWYKDGKIHRDGDLPAATLADGTQKWFREGKEHRDGDLSAAIWADGSQWWYKEGECHRDGDLPAVIFADGSQLWYKDGQEQSRYWLIRRVCWYRAVIAKLV